MSSCGSWIGITSFFDVRDDDDDIGNRIGGSINDDKGGGMRCCSIMSSGVLGPALVGDVLVELDVAWLSDSGFVDKHKQGERSQLSQRNDSTSYLVNMALQDMLLNIPDFVMLLDVVVEEEDVP